MKSVYVFLLLLTLVAVAGCQKIKLANGKYETTLNGRIDFAAVYDDMIIFRLRNAENEEGTENGYWDWGGKYKIIDGNVIKFDMDRETARKWNFYYRFRADRQGILVIDNRAENSFRLYHVPAVKKTPEPANKQFPVYR